MSLKLDQIFYDHIFIPPLILRFILIAYGRFHDSMFELKYTDVDYKVFTDAASFVHRGESPYLRETYRYTPLIAYLLIPNVKYFQDFGKTLFSIFDILTAYFVQKILESSKVPPARSRILILFYLYNPISIAISTRGNLDGLICFVVLSCLYFRMKDQIILSSLCLGFAIHLKLYPIIYLVPFWMSLYKIPIVNEFRAKIKSGPSLSVLIKSHLSLIFDMIFNININHVKFILTLLITLTNLTLLFYKIYGHSFLHETYLYHFSRLDHRHNLSLYFYYIYNLVDQQKKLNFFIHPFFQLLAILICGLYINDLILSMCLQTILFVALNKVCTCQYFIWWISLIPLALAREKNILHRINKLYRSTFLFLLSLGIWLFFGYLLEFMGFSTYLNLLISSVFFTYSQFNMAWTIYGVCDNSKSKTEITKN